MFLILALAALLVGPATAPPPAWHAVRTVPDEPGAVLLPGAATYQAVVADADGDGTRDLVRLVRAERGAIVAEVWRQAGAEWLPAGNGVTVVPPRPTGARARVDYAGTPARLLVRRIEGGSERVSLVRQPRIEEPGIDELCCLLLDDVVVEGGSARLRSVAGRDDAVDAISVIDLDGDGIDELLASRSLLPLGDVSYPTDARVYRWRDGAFAVTRTELPIGSGDTPFIVGDSDGRPGDEAAIVSTLGPPGLFRIALGEGDALRVDDSGVVATDAVAVPLADGRRGMAIAHPPVGLLVAPWPAGGPIGEPETVAPLAETSIDGVVEVGGEAALVVRTPGRAGAQLLAVATLEPSAADVAPSAAAERLRAGPLAPYIGWLPGGGPTGAPTFIASGRVMPDPDGGTDVAPGPTFAGTSPVGFLGRGAAWLAIVQSPVPLVPIDPRGGRLDPPALQPASGVSLVPATGLTQPEAAGGTLDPPISGAVGMGEGVLAVGQDGFAAVVEAPPGTRVTLAAADPSRIALIRTVPESGRLEVAIVSPPMQLPDPAHRAVLTVTTPAGHAYLAAWNLRVLTEPPDLEAAAATSIGSAEVVVRGRTAPYARVEVGGIAARPDERGRFRVEVGAPPWPTDIIVVATDPVGNVARMTVSGVGVFDYRTLPWIPITIASLAIAGVLLFLRIPRPGAPQPAPDDDGALEEMEPDAD